MQPTMYRLTEIDPADAYLPYADALVGRTFQDIDLVPDPDVPGCHYGRVDLVGAVEVAPDRTLSGEFYFYRAKFEAISET